MADSVERVVILSLHPVGPRAATLGEQPFVLHVAAALRGLAGDGAAPLDRQVLPWLWSWGADATGWKVVAKLKGVDALDDRGFAVQLVDGARPPALTALGATETRDWLEKARDYDPRWAPPRSGRAATPRASDVLGYLATQVGALPQALRLAFYFKLVRTSDAAPRWEDVDSFAVAPPVDGWLPERWDPQRREWSYSSGPPPATSAVGAAVRVFAGDGRVRFDDDPARDEPLQPNFTDYWLRAARVPDDLFDRCFALAGLFARVDELVQARRGAAGIDPWEALLETSLAGYAQWDVADGGAAMQALALLAQRAGVAAAALAPLQQALAALRARLADPAARAAAWRAIVAQEVPGFADEKDALARADALHRTIGGAPAILDRMLILQWRHAAAAAGPAVAELWAKLAAAEGADGILGAAPSLERAAIGPVRERTVEATRLVELVARAAAGDHPRADAIAATVGWLEQLGQRRLASAVPSLSGDLAWSGAWSELAARLAADAWADLPATGDDAFAAVPEPHPSGLTLQLAPPSHHTAVDGGDPWRTVAGVGVLVREQGIDPATQKPRPWRLVSGAWVCKKGDRAARLLDRPSPIPLRLPFVDGARDPSVTYEMRPLVAPAPFAEATQDALSQRGSSREPIAARYGYFAVRKGEGFDAFLLTRLRFGASFQMAAFLVDAGGGLPAALAPDPARPWMLSYAAWGEPPAQAVHTFAYRRRVAVGQVRLAPLGGDGVTWPRVPDGVAPLVEEHLGFAGADAGDPRARAAPQPALLFGDAAAASASFTFGVKPPTVAFEVIERWLDDAALLDKAFAEHVARMRRLPFGAEPDSETAFDDPAVTALGVRVESWTLSGGWVMREPLREIKLARRPDEWNVGWTSIACSLVDGGGWSFAPDAADPSRWRLAVPRDEATQIVRVQLYALVERALAGPGGKFASGFFDGERMKAQQAMPPDAPAELRQRYVALLPQRVVLEAPGERFPDEEELWDRFSATARVAERRVELALAVDAASAPRFASVVGCEVIQQPWRWQGRPLPEWPPGQPATAIADADPALLGWEAGAFADLDEQLDAHVVPVAYALPSRANGWRVPLMIDAVDERAQWLRYGVRVRSRYAGLAALSRRFLAHRDAVTAKQRGLAGVGWRRAFLPFAGAAPTKPIVDAIIPVAGADAGAAAAPLLVVLDEPSFAQAGITERLECRVELAVNSDGRSVYQYGHDPIVADAAWAGGLPSPLLATVGPFGYTFDTEARQPLYSASAWLVLPPDGALGWDMAKLRFRRAPGSGVPLAGSDDEWTKPTWVQFIPAASATLTVKASGGLAVATVAEPPPHPARFAYAAMVSRQVFDFGGHAEHETGHRVVAVAASEGSPIALHFPLPDGVPPDRLRVRLLELQLPSLSPSLPSPSQLWNALISADGNEEAGCRITRMWGPARLR